MNEYDFVLKFSLGSTKLDSQAIADRLFESGCDDGLVGTGLTGRVAIHFLRQAKSALAAIQSALRNVKTALPEASLIEASPDLVGLTDIADIVGCSRQNIRKLAMTSADFPAPAYDGSTTLWHLANIIPWLKAQGRYSISDEILQVAQINMAINLAGKMGTYDSSQLLEQLAEAKQIMKLRNKVLQELA